jgi:hypothetical protein
MTRVERAAPALCRCDKLPENIKFEGRPMWESYIGEAQAALAAVEEPEDGKDTCGEAT